MAENIKGEHTARIGGTERRLRLGIDEMIEIEAALGLVGKGGVFSLMKGVGYTEALVVIHYGLKGAGATHDIKATRKMCDGLGFAELGDAAIGAILAAQPKASEDAEKNGDAPGASD